MSKTMTLEEARVQMIAEAKAIIDKQCNAALAFAVEQINAGFIQAFPMRLGAFLAMRKEQEPGVTGELDDYQEEQPIALLYREWVAMERHLAGAPVH